MLIYPDFSSSFVAVRFRFRQAVLMLLHTKLKQPLAIVHVYVGVILRLFGIKKIGLGYILKGRRIYRVKKADVVINELVSDRALVESELLGLLGEGNNHPIEDYHARILILKTPTVNNNTVIERGAIIIKFSETFSPMYSSLDVELLSKYFRIILEPSSVGYSLPDILIWATLYPEEVVVLSPYQDDFDLLSSINANLVPIKLGPADWVDTSVFYQKVDSEKKYDALYVANYNPIKRVDRYIRAVARIQKNRPLFKAALICAANTGSAKSEIHATLKHMKNVLNIDFLDNMSQSSLNTVFNESKVNILISLREGANKGLAEGLFAGSPALIVKENVGGNHLHINSSTGLIVPDSELEKTLIWFSDHYNDFTPSEWAVKNISPAVSTMILSNKLKELEINAQRQWTTDLYSKVNRPELAYVDRTNSWLLPKRVELLNCFRKGSKEDEILKFLETLNRDDLN